MSTPSNVPGHRAGWGAGIDTTGGADGQRSRSDVSGLVDRADEPADYGPWLKRWIWPAILAVSIAAGMVVGGIDMWRAVLVALGVAVALWAVIASMTAPRIRWHEDVPGERYRSTSSWEVPGLAGARESDTAFSAYLRPRLWALAEDLLRARGIDPTSDRARKLIGPRQYDLLTGADVEPRRMTSSVSVLCQTIAHLAVDPQAGGRPPVDTPSLRGLAGAPRARNATHISTATKGNTA